MLNALASFFFRSLRDRRANVAIVTALCAVPLSGLFGFAMDYGSVLSNKAKLDSAADSAALVAITTAGHIADGQGGSMTSPTDALSAGRAAGRKAFAAASGRPAFATDPTPAVEVTNPGHQVITATVSYSAVARAGNLSKIIGINSISLSGSSTATLRPGPYLDFYLLLDVPGSRSALARGARRTNSQAPGARGQHADSIERAVCALLTAAISAQTLTNQFRVGVFPFAQDRQDFYPLSTDLKGAIKAVTGGSGTCPKTLLPGGLAGLFDRGRDVSLADPVGSGRAGFEKVLMAKGASPGKGGYVETTGTGARSASPKPFVFLVTDVTDTSQAPARGGNGAGLNPITSISPAACDQLKAQGVTISILSISDIDSPAGAGVLSQMQAGTNRTDPHVAPLPEALARCAPAGFFYTAHSSADVAAAMNAMFNQAIQVAR